MKEENETSSGLERGSPSPGVSGSAKGFRVMLDPRHPKIKHPALIPWEVVAPHEKQAQRNHYQTLERLNERGGLSAVELWHVVNDKDWHGALPCGARVTIEQAAQWLNNLIGSSPNGELNHCDEKEKKHGST
jgi:hypothetical protein